MDSRFTSEGLLGTGGQGRVFAVRDAARGGAIVALKERPMTATAELRGEFELLTRLRHPHIAAVHDWLPRSPIPSGEGDAGRSAYTQDLLKGTDFFSALREAPDAERDEAVEQLLRALAYLHALDVVHLDLKPDNVFVSRESGRVMTWVLDFGVAEHRGTLTDYVMGSRSYVAPERLSGEAVDPRADLFAVGVMMAEVSSGQPQALYTSPQLQDARRRRAYFESVGVDARWLEVVVALTAFESHQRPRSVYEAARLFEKGIQRRIALHTPATVAAILRAGAPVGHDRLQVSIQGVMAEGGAHVITGAAGTGRRTLARQTARRMQLQGHPMEVWPGSDDAHSTKGFAAACRRLLGQDGGLAQIALESTLAEQRATGVDAAALERFLRDAVSGVVERFLTMPAAPSRPLLVIEDLERAPWPVRLLALAMVEAYEDGRPLPLGLLVVTESYPGPAAVPVEPLTRDDVGRLLDQRLGAGVSNDALATALTGASGGNPGVLEALLTLMVQRGELRFGPQGWAGPEDGALGPLPEAFGAAIRARLELLSEDALALVSAVAWLRFPTSQEGVMAALGVDTLPPGALEEMEAIGLLRPLGDATWALSHQEVREALGAWRPPGGEKAGHRRVSERSVLEGLALAWHTGGPEGAAMAVSQGEAAWATGAMHDAAAAFALAEELAPDDPVAIEGRANVADLLGPRDLQIQCLEALAKLRPPDSVEALKARARLLWTLTRTANVEQARVLGEAVLEEALRLGELGVHRAALVDLANVAIQRGDYEEGQVRLLDAQRCTDSEAFPGDAARISNNLGNILAYRGDNQGALDAYSEALRLKRIEGEPVGTRIAVGNMGLMCLRLERYSEALEHFAASLRAAKSLSHRRGEAWSLNAIAELGKKAGALDFAERRARMARELAKRLGDRVIACDALITLAEIARQGGRREEALDCARAGLAEALDVDSSYNALAARALLACLLVTESPAEAKALALEALESGEEESSYASMALMVLAKLEIAEGRLESAWGHLEDALERVGDKADEELWEAAVSLAELRGDGGRVQRFLTRASAELFRRETTWPVAAFDDGADANGRGDGPSRDTWRAKPWVMALRERVQGEAERADTVALSQVAGAGTGLAERSRAREEVSWAELLVEGDGAIAAATRWLKEFVASQGAERGFMLLEGGGLLASSDADGEPVVDAAGKLPKGAVEQALNAGGLWRGSLSRGALWCAIEAAPEGKALTLILQNRFDAAAFSGLDEVPDSGRLRLISLVLGLREALKRSEERAREAEATFREEAVRSTEHLLQLRRALEATREQLGPKKEYTEIIYDSAVMQRMLQRVERVVDSELPVWIFGESGTGKELVARALHRYGVRAEGPFVAQNCSAIPAPLFESEFFGHVRGAFTGAHRDQEGLFQRADGGTLFLDEVGDLPLEQQAKLLRVLETGEVVPVGASTVVRVDARVVCATHRNLEKLVAEGRFREDLFYRLNVVKLEVPPLRQRPEDISLLVEHFLTMHPGPDGATLNLGSGVMKALLAYDWPGNVRELENEVRRAALLCDGFIALGDLSKAVRDARPRLPEADMSDGLEELGLTVGTLKQRVERLEYVLLKDAMSRRDNKSQVAREMGLSRAGLNMKLKRLGLWRDG